MVKKQFEYVYSEKLAAARRRLQELRAQGAAQGVALDQLLSQARALAEDAVLIEAKALVGEATAADVATAQKRAAAAREEVEKMRGGALDNGPALLYLADQIERLEAEEKEENFQRFRPLATAAAGRYAAAIDELIAAGDELIAVGALAPQLWGALPSPIAAWNREDELANPGKFWKYQARQANLLT